MNEMVNTKHICRICGNSTDNRPCMTKERMLGLNDEFEYFECSNCLCLQISEIPKDIDRYYPANYYSYRQPVFATKLTGFRYFLKKSLAGYFSGKFNIVGFLLSPFYENPFTWLKPNIVSFSSKILDVGSGTGRLLLSMKRSGYQNLTGIDPYNSEDIFYENGVRVLKKDVFDLDEQFDLIMLHHSFEHMQDPKAILDEIGKHIEANGHLIIRIPVANSYAWRKYHSHWVQLDAPRHFFLHTVKSMNILANECGLKICSADYESTAFQFTGSEKYLRGIGFSEKDTVFSQKQMRIFRRESKRLNQLNDGDSVCFYLQKI
jgi:SAM-dependent methyltransferase